MAWTEHSGFARALEIAGDKCKKEVKLSGGGSHARGACFILVGREQDRGRLVRVLGRGVAAVRQPLSPRLREVTDREAEMRCEVKVTRGN